MRGRVRPYKNTFGLLDTMRRVTATDSWHRRLASFFLFTEVVKKMMPTQRHDTNVTLCTRSTGGLWWYHVHD